MNSSYDEMMKLYSELEINDKRNEFSSLLEKINQIISELLRDEKIENNLSVKNYNQENDLKLSEDEMFTFLYEDLWNIKNRLLTLLILKSSKKN